ncbi:hypothetical protein JCM10212_005515 [Sporobolomyces blumeae]
MSVVRETKPRDLVIDHLQTPSRTPSCEIHLESSLAPKPHTRSKATMDSDNPWDAPSPLEASPNLSPSDATTEPVPGAPKLSLEVDEEEGASWGTQQDKGREEEERDGDQATEASSTRDDGDAPTTTSSEPTGQVEQAHDSGTGEGDAANETPALPADAPSSSPPSPDLPPPVPLVTAESSDERASPSGEAGVEIAPAVEPPMDDFPTESDDDDAFSTSSTPAPTDSIAPPPAFSAMTTSEAPPMDDFDDFDDDEFGEGQTGGDATADDDFGDFGDAAPLDDAAFDAPAPAPAPSAFERTASLGTPTPPPPTTSTTTSLPPLQLSFAGRPTRASVAPQLREFIASAWGDPAGKVSEEPERQVEGVAQVLVTEGSRNLLATLSSLPPLKPLDWRRSKIRREHLVSMGIPVNLDDSADPKPLSSLALSASPHLSGSTLSRPSSAPPGSSPLPFSASRVSSRPSTPFADRGPSASRRAGGGGGGAGIAGGASTPPPLDLARANHLVSIKEQDLTLMSVDALRDLTRELERVSVDASGVLTHALLAREKEGQDKETYNGMISDLVSAAAKMKTTSAAGATKGRDPKRQGSIRWGRSGG